MKAWKGAVTEQHQALLLEARVILQKQQQDPARTKLLQVPNEGQGFLSGALMENDCSAS